MDAANAYLKAHFIPAFNERFGVKPKDTEGAFVPYLGTTESLREILCLHHQRQVNRDNTVSFNKLSLQLSASPGRRSYFKTQVHIHEYANGCLSIFHGPRKLADYEKDRTLIEDKADSSKKQTMRT